MVLNPAGVSAGHPATSRFVKDIAVIAYDALCVIAAVCLAVWMTMSPVKVEYMASEVLPAAMLATIPAICISWCLGIFSTRWRLASLLDFVALIKSALLWTLPFWLVRSGGPSLTEYLPFANHSRTIILCAVFIIGLQASGRVIYRYYRFLIRRNPDQKRRLETALFAGNLSEIESALRAAEQGLVSMHIAGGLLQSDSGAAKTVRGKPVLGSVNDLEFAIGFLQAGGQHVSAVIVSPSVLAHSADAQSLKRVARRLGLKLLRYATIEVGERAEIRFVEFLFREKKKHDHRLFDASLRDKRLLVTGGGGTIGGDISLRAAAHGAAEVVLLDIAELGLQTRLAELAKNYPGCRTRGVICDVRDKTSVMRAVATINPDIVVHAAALKHVDLTEMNWAEAVKTNVFGTGNVLDAVDAANVPLFINISTDKAADPVSMLGWTKRFGEQLVTARSARENLRRFSVRFGNVLGSSGSVAEVFMQQIAKGGPLTLTHRDATRYFMSREEAAELVLITSSVPFENAQRSSLFILDMGEQIPIRYLATQMIEWAGLVPDKDIKIVESGLRPGERISEKLVSQDEKIDDTKIPVIKTIVGSGVSSELTARVMRTLATAVASDDRQSAEQALKLVDRQKGPANSVHLSAV